MRVLLIHQNFPGQYKHLGPALAGAGHEVVALTPRAKEPATWQGIRIVPYRITRSSSQNIHPWLGDFETKIIRGEACYHGAIALKKTGFSPDVILAHHGWGEAMFLKDVWPSARMGLYCELYYQAEAEGQAFDPEFPAAKPGTDALRMRLRNINNAMHFDIANAGISPTQFQASTFPEPFRSEISVIHDGINTHIAQPKPDVTLPLSNGKNVSRSDEVITFINRNLEPYRGYHVFMRALPELLRARPDAQIVILGGDEVSYGAAAPKGTTWKQIYIDEVRGKISDENWARVHFLGRIPYDRFLQVIQVSRVHIYLTYPFVLSWSLMESMATEAAIVASHTAPVVEVLEHEKTAQLINFFDQDALVGAVVKLCEDAQLRDALGQNARTFIKEHYDLQKICLPKQLSWVDKLAEKTPKLPRV